jgi:hypothetical protein
MSIEVNTRIARRWMELWKSGESDKLGEVYAPDFEPTDRTTAADLVLEDLIVDDHKAVVRWSFGNPDKTSGITILAIESGKITRRWEENNRPYELRNQLKEREDRVAWLEHQLGKIASIPD